LSNPRSCGNLSIDHAGLTEYSGTEDRSVFMIDGQVMDENRVDQTIKLGNTEEWTLINTDQQYHSFHIQQTAFRVMALACPEL